MLPAILLLCILQANDFTFRDGQSAYIVAVRSDSGDLTNSALDLNVEREVKRGFQKRKSFKIANSLKDADFVLIVVSQYKQEQTSGTMIGGVFIASSENLRKNVLALAVLPQDFAAHRSDIVALRDTALWTADRGASYKVKIKSVVEDLFKSVLKK